MFVGNKNRVTGTGTTKLGEILVEAGVIKNDLIIQSLAIAKNSKLPIGRVLTMYGFTNEKVIESALAAQKGLRDGRFNRQQASQLVRVAYTSQVNLEQAQSIVGLSAAAASKFGELGRILMAAGVVDDNVLAQAKAEIELTNKTVGQWLLEKGTIDVPILVNALHLALLSRDGSLPRVDAVSVLKRVHTEKVTVPDAADALNLGTLPEQKDIHLAAFLILAQFVDQRLVMQTLEDSLDRGAFFGDILVDQQALTPLSLDAAIHLQEMVEHEILELEQACDIFSFVADLNAPLDGLLVEFEKMSEIAKFIISTKVVPEEELAKFSISGDSTDILLGITLLRSGLVTETQVGYASHLQDLIAPSNLTHQEAVGILHYCFRYNVEPEEAVKKFGLKEIQIELPSTDDEFHADGLPAPPVTAEG